MNDNCNVICEHYSPERCGCLCVKSRYDELLEGLEAILKAIRYNDEEALEYEIDKAYKVISKARGRE